MKQITLSILFVFALSEIYCQTPVQEICTGSQHIYNIDNLNTELIYTWGIYNKQGEIQSLKADNSAIEITWDNSTGTDSLWLVANDNSCQSDTSKLIIKRIALPNASFEQTKVCNGEALQVNFSGEKPFKLRYIINGSYKVISEITENTYQLNEVSGDLSLFELRDKNCLTFALSGNINAEIMQALPTLSLENAELNDTTCINSNKEYQIQNPEENSTYSWGIYANTGTVFDQNNKNILINWNNSEGNDSIWFVEQNEFACKGDTSIQKIIKTNQPNVNFSDTVICYGESLNLEFSGSPPFSVEYLFNGNTFSQNVINTDNYLFSHLSGTYKLLNLSDKYCSSFALSEKNTAFIDISLNELSFNTHFDFVDSVLLNELKTYFISNKSENTVLKWEVSNGNILSENPTQNDSISVLWNIEGIGLLEVYEETQNNCVGTASTIDIIISEKNENDDSKIVLNIPNVFTPNNDGKNDVFEIKSKYLPKSFLLVIKNRWGRKVFKSDDINNSWNGKTNNENCSEGVYFYVIQFLSQDVLVQKNGFVHLYR